MAAPSQHPAPRDLQQLLAGGPAAGQSQLIAHLDQCADCRALLETMAGAPPALLQAAGALPRNTHLGEPSLRRVLDALGNDTGLATLSRSQDPAGQGSGLGAQTPLPAGVPLESLSQLSGCEVTRVLGQGGMGQVFQAFDATLKRWVAIKMLAANLSADQGARLRFAREAQAAAAVRHPHVITIHSVSEVNGLPYFVMEYLAGGSLQDYLDQHGPPAWPAIARLGAEVAAGLAAAHAQGLIHRDIKPSNILLEPGDSPAALGTAKIGDFGLARVIDGVRLTQTGLVAGTPMYMAPEQALGEPLDHRADLFSLGSVLYTLCTGREPFPESSPVVLLRQVCELTPTPVRDLNPAIPPWLAAVVERLHAKRPEDRLASAAEVAELLRYNLEHPDQPRTVSPPRPPQRTRRSRWTRRRLLLLAGAALLVLVGAAATASFLGLRLPWQEGALCDLRSRATLTGHDGPVLSVAFAPSGETLATGSDDDTVRLWDAVTGKEKAKLRGHQGPVLSVAFAHSGATLISGSGDGTIHLWDVATGREQAPLALHGTVRRIVCSPDHTVVAAIGNAQGVELWDIETRQPRLTLPGHDSSIVALAFAADGKTLATGDANGHIWLWDLARGAPRADFQASRLGLRALAFAPDSQTLASASTGEMDVKLWRLATNEQIGTLFSRDGVINLAFSPRGTLLAGGDHDGALFLWDVSPRRLLARVRAHQSIVRALAFSPDGHTLATVGDDKLGQLWDLSSLPDAQP